jgi:hypothetical protein
MRCSDCEHLEAKKWKNRKDVLVFQELKKMHARHIEAVMEERYSYEVRIQQGILWKKQFLSMVIDGSDNQQVIFYGFIIKYQFEIHLLLTS